MLTENFTFDEIQNFRRMKKCLLIFTSLLIYVQTAIGQVEAITDNVASLEYKLSTVKSDQELYKLVFGSLPDLNACKAVFIGNYAYEYYDNVSKLKELLSKEVRPMGDNKRSVSLYNFVKLVPVSLQFIAEKTSVSYINEAKNTIKSIMKPTVVYYKAYANHASRYRDLNDWIFVNVSGQWFTIIEPWKLEKSVSQLKTVDENTLFKKPSGSELGITSVDSIAPKGSIDSNSMYGKTGGAKTGMALNVSGWGMGARPQVNGDFDESGRIVFEITVDDTGDIIGVRVKESTVSQYVVDLHKRAVSRMKLVPKYENVPRLSKGTITFNIKSI